MTDTHDCFICHASEDKDEAARPIAEGLTDRGYSIWFDEFELGLGDSLSGAIERGLASSKFGVVVLSRAFFAKNYPQHELSGLTAKEILGEYRIILPVWHGVDAEYLAGVAPTLADRYGVKTSDGMDHVLDEISNAIERRQQVAGDVSAATAAAAEPVALQPAEPTLQAESGSRIRRGISDEEMYAANAADQEYRRGWLSVVVGPVSLQDDLLDPTEIAVTDLRNLNVPALWDPSYNSPLTELNLVPDLPGFRARIPQEGPPAYLVNLYQDGLMEFGYALDRGDGYIPTHAVGTLIHDWTLTFLKVLEVAGYTGEAVANASHWQVAGLVLGVAQNRMFGPTRKIVENEVPSRPLRGLVPELPSEVGRWTKKICDRLFLAGGITSGAYFIDDDGNPASD